MKLVKTALLFCAGIASFASAQELLPPATVVAKRGSAQLTLGDIDAYMQRVPEDKRASMMNSSKRIEGLLLNMLLNEQLANQAVEMKLDQVPEAKDATGWARTEVLSSLRMQEFMNDMKLPDFEILAKEEYQGHREKYAAPANIDIQRIMIDITTEKRNEEASWALINKIHDEAVAKPDDFTALVAQYSEDADKQTTHGMLQDVLKNKTDRILLDAVSQLTQIGQISIAFRSKTNFDVIKLVKREPGAVASFADAHDAIVARLKMNYIDATRRELIDGLSSEKIDANEDAVASLRTRYLPAGAKLPDVDKDAGPTQNPGAQAPAGEKPPAH